MLVSFNCPKCSGVLQAEQNWSGQQTQCPFCKSTIVIPPFTSSASQNNSTIGTQSDVLNASATPISSFFAVRMFNAFLDAFRRIRLFSHFLSFKNYVVKFGVICYWVLGILLFIVACMRSSDATSAWLVIIYGLWQLIEAFLFSYVGICIFQLCNVASSQSKEHGIPLEIANITAVVALGCSLYYLVTGITESFATKNGLLPLYSALRYVAFSLPIFIVSIAPSNIFISIKEQPAIETFSGIFNFMLKSVLFAIPFLWAYEALVRTIQIVIHLGAEKSEFAQAASMASENLFSKMMMPVYCYAGYLLLNFVYTAIKCHIEKQSR